MSYVRTLYHSSENACHWYFSGYMAPEYLVRGQLTEKADVYSFGVLVLEIVCGRRNSAFAQDSGSLLQTVRSFVFRQMFSAILVDCFQLILDCFRPRTRSGNYTNQRIWLKLSTQA